ncbi:MAG TPA: isochorismatase family protein [Bacteroidaceae bacterium]|nr:isochorismatase family protein [Bacteroidaceae bacterium]
MKKIILTLSALILFSIGGPAQNRESTRNILLVVDLQKDFIDGSLAVNGAEEIVPLIDNIKGKFDYVYFTLDWHPFNHCSFTPQNGPWPVHCVNYSEGASIPNKILSDLDSNKIRFFEKGSNANEEEYGAFSNITTESGIFNAGDKIVVCGIAAEYCVLETLKNIVKMRDTLKLDISVYLDGVACIESFNPLTSFMSEMGISQYK